MDEFNMHTPAGTPAEAAPPPTVQTQDSGENLARAKFAYSASLGAIALYMILGEVLGMVFITIAKQLLGVTNLHDSLAYLLNFIPMYFIAFPIMMLVGKNIEKSPPEKHSVKPGQFVLLLIMCFAILVAGAVFGNIVNLMLGTLFGFKIDSSKLTEGIMGEGATVLSIFAVLGAPVIEEMICRKFLIDRVRKYGNGLAILVSGIVFGLIHGNFSQCFFAAGIGIFFGFIYVRTGKIQYTIALHMIINFIGSVISGAILRNIDYNGFLEFLDNPDLKKLLDMASDLIPLLVFEAFEYSLAIAGLVLLIVFRKKFTLPPAEAPLAKGQRVQAVLCNYGSIVLICLCIALFVITGIQLYGKMA